MLSKLRTRLQSSTLLRLALANAAVFGLAATVLLGVVYLATVGYMSRQLDEIIAIDVHALERVYAVAGKQALIGEISHRLTDDRGDDRVYLLAGKNYDPIAGNLPAWPETSFGRDGWSTFEAPASGRDRDDTRTIRATRVDLSKGAHFLVGRDMHDLEETKEVIWAALGWAFLLVPILAGIGGGLMSFTIVRRLNRINRAAQAIINGDLSRRVRTGGRADEFDRLAENINAMLDHIAALMETVRNVSNDISHDLRTPLTHLRTSIEKAQRARLEGNAYDAWVDDMLMSVDEILRTFEAILKIAEIDSGQPRRWFKTVDLTRVVSDVVEVYGAVAEAKNQSFSSEIGAVTDVHGDRDLLFRAIANVIDNAIKHTPEGGRVVITLGPVDGIPELIVADNGPGIPAEAHELVFRPLYRLDQSRGTPGRGLGLSIVAAVAALHGIELELDDNKPGLAVTMRFPIDSGGRDSAVITHRKRWFAFLRHYRRAQRDAAQTSE